LYPVGRTSDSALLLDIALHLVGVFVGSLGLVLLGIGFRGRWVTNDA